MKKNDISLVVVDAVPYMVEEEGDEVQPTIQELVNYGLTDRIYEFSQHKSELNHNGVRVKTFPGDNYEIGVARNIILTGGAVGGDKYREIFRDILKQITEEKKFTELHIPFDCTYHISYETFDGEGPFSYPRIVRPNNQKVKPLLDMLQTFGPKNRIIIGYHQREDAPKYVPRGHIVNVAEGEKPDMILTFWNRCNQMADYLGKK